MKINDVINLGAGALAVLASVATPGIAGAQTVSDEVRCVMLSNALASGSNNPRGRQIGASVGAYFMGRLDARRPAEIKAALAAQKRQVSSAQAATMMNACVMRASRAETHLRALAK
jgi:hypothetical protein